MPSVIFTALTDPVITRAAKIKYTTQGSRSSTPRKGTYRLGDRIPIERSRARKHRAAASCSRNFWLADRPVFSFFFTLA